jgi:hypothetical protein
MEALELFQCMVVFDNDFDLSIVMLMKSLSINFIRKNEDYEIEGLPILFTIQDEF